jgi:hypothetical protein
MKTELEKAVKVNAERASEKGISADEALKFTQACTNAANALACLSNIK